MMKPEFTTKELASEILLWMTRDVPNTVVSALKIILSNYIRTGIWDDKREYLTGYPMRPVLTVQRIYLEFDRLYEEIERLKKMKKIPVTVSLDLWSKIIEVLEYYASHFTYEAERVSGVLGGCKRGELPTPEMLSFEAKIMLRRISDEISTL